MHFCYNSVHHQKCHIPVLACPTCAWNLSTKISLQELMMRWAFPCCCAYSISIHSCMHSEQFSFPKDFIQLMGLLCHRILVLIIILLSLLLVSFSHSSLGDNEITVQGELHGMKRHKKWQKIQHHALWSHHWSRAWLFQWLIHSWLHLLYTFWPSGYQKSMKCCSHWAD